MIHSTSSDTTVIVTMTIKDALHLLSAHEEGDSLQDSPSGNDLLRCLQRAADGWVIDGDTDEVVRR